MVNSITVQNTAILPVSSNNYQVGFNEDFDATHRREAELGGYAISYYSSHKAIPSKHSDKNTLFQLDF